MVVVSAMGRKPSPYATDSLLSLVEEFAEHSNIAELDQLMSCGETLSAIVVSHTFRKNDIPSRSFDGRQAAIETTEEHGNAKIVYIDPEPLLTEEPCWVLVVGTWPSQVDPMLVPGRAGGRGMVS